MMTRRSLYQRHRFPSEIIRYAVWLYYRFSLSYRDVEELLAERGVNVSYERSGAGALDLARSTPTGSVNDPGPAVINGSSMKCLSESMDSNVICIERWIKTARSWISWTRHGEIRGPRPHIGGCKT